MRKIFIFLAMLCSTVANAEIVAKLVIPEIEHGVIHVYYNLSGGEMLTGAPVHAGDGLEFRCELEPHYRIAGEYPTGVSLTDDMFVDVGGGEYEYRVPAPTLERTYYVRFESSERATFAEAMLNGDSFSGGDVLMGEWLYYKYVANRGYLFTDNDGIIYEMGLTLESSQFDEDTMTVSVPDTYIKNVVISYRLLDASSAEIIWDGYGLYDSYRLCVSAEELTGNPDYWKGMQVLSDTSYIVTGLEVGRKYYVYLEGSIHGEANEWVVATFVMQEPGDPCVLTIDMMDSCGDSWNDGGLIIKEGDDETFITLEAGSKGTATYISNGYPIQISWHAGRWDSEVAFVVRAGDGRTIARVDYNDLYECPDGYVFYEGVLCTPLCSLSNLQGTASGTNFRVTWDAEGADYYDVAVMQVVNPREGQLDSAKVSVRTKSYSFTGDPYHGYYVFVRPVNAQAFPQRWQHVFVYETLPLTNPTLSQYSQEISLTHMHTGELEEDAVWYQKGDNLIPICLYKFFVRDSTDVTILTYSEATDPYFFLFQEDPHTGYNDTIAIGDLFTGKVRGWFYVMLTTHGDPQGEYTIIMAKNPEAEVIDTLDFYATGDLMDADMMLDPNYGISYAKCYRYTPKDTVEVNYMLKTINYNFRIGVYINELAPGTLSELDLGDSNTPRYAKLLKDSTYYFLVLGRLGDNTKPTDTYSLSIYDRNKPETPLEPVAIGLNETQTGTFADAAYWKFPFTSDIVPTKAFSIRLTDTTNVQVKFDSPDYDPISMMPSMYYTVFLDSIGGYIVTANTPNIVNPSVLTFLPDTTYYVVISSLIPYGGSPTASYSLTVYKEGDIPQPAPLVAKAVSLDYTESGDFTDAVEWLMPQIEVNVLAKAFSITPKDTVELKALVESPDATGGFPPSMYYMLFQGSINSRTSISGNMPNYSLRNTLLPDTTYYVVICAIPQYGGKSTDRYTLSLTDITGPTKTIMLDRDTILVDSLTAKDRILEWDEMGRIYEFVLTEDKTISFSIEYLGDDPEDARYLGLYLYSDINDWSIDYADAYDSYYAEEAIRGSAEGKHYYLVAYCGNEKSKNYRMTFRLSPAYNNVPIKGEIAVNVGYRSALSIKDGFTSHGTTCSSYHRGNYEAYKVHLEKDSIYRIMMYVPKQDNWDYDGHSLTIFNPGSDTITYDQSMMGNACEADDSNDGWAVYPFMPDSTADYVIMFDDYVYSKYLEDSVVYEFSVEQVVEFTDLVTHCPAVQEANLPIRENGVFTDNKKVLPDWSYEFHNVNDTYIDDYGAYDALARAIRIDSEDTLFVEFGGDADATIQIYDGNTLALLKTIDSIPYNFPYESGFIVNDLPHSKDYIVVCSFNEVVLTDAAWSLRMSKSEKDLEPILVTPQADKQSIEIYDTEGVAEALDALSQINLTAVDAANAVVCTLTNDRFAWQVDIEGGSARYEFNDMDLPTGYKFVEPVMYVVVEIERIPDPHTGFINTEFGEEGKTIKFIQNGQVFIQRDGMIFNILGQRVK